MARAKKSDLATIDGEPEEPGQRVLFRPEHTEIYPVAKAARFKDDAGEKTEYCDAPELQELAEQIQQSDPYFSKLQGSRIHYLWKASSGMAKGKPIFGDVARPGQRSLLRYYGGPDLILWLSANRVAEFNLNRWQVEALVCSLLCRVEINDEGRLGIVGPDFVGFVHEIERYGAWHPRMQDLRAAIQPELPFQFETFAPAISDEPVDVNGHRAWGSQEIVGGLADADAVAAAFDQDQERRQAYTEVSE